MQIVNPHKTYKSSDTCRYSCQYHVVFCPKYRRSVLSEDIQQRFKEIVQQKQSEYNYEILDMEVLPNHVHLLLDVSPHVGIHSVVTKIKGSTSRILRDEFAELKSKLPTLWSSGKFISTVGAVTLEVVKKYIEEQKNK